MSNKPFQFHATAGSFFVAALISTILVYIPLVGWAIAVNYIAGWFAGNVTVDGKKIEYSAKFGETLVFLIVNILLVLITFGIYVFWFYPKLYRYMLEHTNYATVPATPVAAPVTEQTPAPASTPTPPTVQ